MPDVSLVNRQVSSAPKDYQLPQAQEILLKAVRADFDCSSATVPCLPCVQIISDAGDVMWSSVDQSVSIAAAGSASVSWFPGVKQSQAIEWAYLSSNGTSTSCSGTANTRLTTDATTFYTNAPGLYDVHANAGIDGIRLLADGHYLFWVSARPTSLPAAGDNWELIVLGGGEFPDFSFAPIGLLFPTGAQIDQGISVNGGVMCVGNFITAPTNPIIAQINVASAATMHWEVGGIVVMRLDAANQDLN